MIALLQRVSTASVDTAGQRVAEINKGVLVFVAIQPRDTMDQAIRLVKRIYNYRIFPDDQEKMNLSVRDIQGEVIFVPQFTLAADTDRGNRPSFSKSATPEEGKLLFEQLLVHAKKEYSKVQNGVFGADMQVNLTNDGPVTFWLEAH